MGMKVKTIKSDKILFFIRLKNSVDTRLNNVKDLFPNIMVPLRFNTVRIFINYKRLYFECDDVNVLVGITQIKIYRKALNSKLPFNCTIIKKLTRDGLSTTLDDIIELNYDYLKSTRLHDFSQIWLDQQLMKHYILVGGHGELRTYASVLDMILENMYDTIDVLYIDKLNYMSCRLIYALIHMDDENYNSDGWKEILVDPNKEVVEKKNADNQPMHCIIRPELRQAKKFVDYRARKKEAENANNPKPKTKSKPSISSKEAYKLITPPKPNRQVSAPSKFKKATTPTTTPSNDKITNITIPKLNTMVNPKINNTVSSTVIMNLPKLKMPTMIKPIKPVQK